MVILVYLNEVKLCKTLLTNVNSKISGKYMSVKGYVVNANLITATHQTSLSKAALNLSEFIDRQRLSSYASQH